MKSKSDVRIEFDHHRPEFSVDRTAAAHELQKCPVAWTDQHGGYWVLSSYEDIALAGKSPETFASGNDHGEGPLQGLNIPFIITGAGGLIESDPPRHFALRKQINQWFSPGAVNRFRSLMEEDVTFFIDRFIEFGHADLVHDLIGPFPGLVTMRLLGVPVEYYEPFADIVHRTLYTAPGTPERDEVDAGMGEIAGHFLEWIEVKRVNPKNDYLSFLATVELDGRPLSLPEVLSEAILVLGAGIDTTTALMGHSLRYLSQHPDLKAWLVEDPKRLGPSCEEFLRMFTPVNGTARTVTHDVVVRDCQLQAGERVWLMWHAANHDAETFDDPDTVHLDREPNRHLAFASGPHRCIGAHFARAEWQLVVSAMLERLPDFVIDDDAVVPFPDLSVTAGFISMPMSFTPGLRQGPGTLRAAPAL